MSILDGVSECWHLGSTCAIDWDAWSSIGTMLGVLTALSVPAIRRHFASRRVNSIFAAVYITPLHRAKIGFEEFCICECVDARTGGPINHLLRPVPTDEFIRAARQLDAALKDLSTIDIDLSKFPEVGALLAADVSRASHFARDMRLLIEGLNFAPGVSDEETWKGYWVTWSRTWDNARDVALHAAAACSDAMNRMSILKRLR
ncbi:hypothetical protein I5U05_013655 [Stenotrophomonas maltophilia]|uniref:hypothetical protein n=1 Tax=Stenotrophomonas maltophilia TaxID=40324 RepID=UPI0014526C6A|nr:hypothetical protein [Stenotrophomonas maltophilia]MBC8771025.1 hypothetical protein [Stenotrophomonas maltophilia]MBH1608957.1 hypothetical protein [Stenotrophomonas maltophilia]MBH1725900.1 hypothetical protein [Stenotrophomonas maltophilia]MBH1798878.1 hypothetical protein [Stenotrophomonas maltophilia]MBH1805852.1 hypothetical protein [Stenotrophomonas maltophilia]